MTAEVLGYLALFISGFAAIFTTSRLSLGVFIFLVVWGLSDLALHQLNAYYLYPALFIGILIDYGLLLWLSITRIRCIIVPLVTAFSALYAVSCLITWHFGMEALLNQYGLVMGITALLASLEGAWHGSLADRRVFSVSDKHSNRGAWPTTGIHIDKESL